MQERKAPFDDFLATVLWSFKPFREKQVVQIFNNNALR